MSKNSLRDFDPKRVAELDTLMWEAYYKHKFIRLFSLLMALFKEQFRVSRTVAMRLAYNSMRAAMIFRKTENEQRVKKFLVRYYQTLGHHASEKFDVKQAAETELRWWIVHRYPKQGSLPQALSANMAVIYSIPSSALKEYGRYRAEAMKLRDTGAHDSKQSPDWGAIQSCLEKSYTALKTVVTS